jgi:hypothetical protein
MSAASVACGLLGSCGTFIGDCRLVRSILADGLGPAAMIE